MALGTTPLESGEIVFVQNHLPALQSGEYLIKVEQVLRNSSPKDPNGRDAINDNFVHTRHIAVQGERFLLDPAELEAFFPPEGEGEYANVLPHVVFTRRTLPWERSPDGTDDGKPWLSLLVFHEDDSGVPALQQVMVGDLQRSAFARVKDAAPTASQLPATAASYPDGFAALPSGTPGQGLEFALEHGENLYDRCDVIDVPVALFGQIAPAVEELRWLSHARTVRTDNKPGTITRTSVDYSVVVANRLPESGKKCTVHLVSLEGMAKLLPSYAADGSLVPATIVLNDAAKTPATTVRLVTLKSWTFTPADPAQSFSGYLEKLDVGPLRLPWGAGTPSTAEEKAVANAFDLGYTALNHQTRQGDQTVSWYRGPFVPFQVPSTIVVPIPDATPGHVVEPITNSDQLVRYDPDSGMFDMSYAAAWQIGRLLALHDKSFSVALYNWKRANARDTAFAEEARIINLKFGGMLPMGTGGLLQSAGGMDLMEAAAHFMTTTLMSHLVPEEALDGASAGDTNGEEIP